MTKVNYSKWYNKENEKIIVDKAEEIIRFALDMYKSAPFESPCDMVFRRDKIDINMVECLYSFYKDKETMKSYVNTYGFVPELDKRFRDENLTIEKNTLDIVTVLLYREEDDDELY